MSVPFRGRHVCRPYAWTKRGRNAKTVHKATDRGPHTCGPYKPGQPPYNPYPNGRFAAGRGLPYFPVRCFFNNVPHSNSRRLAGRRGGRITAIPGEVGFAGGAAVLAPPRHFPCPHKAAAAVRVYVLLAGRTPARVSLRVLRPLPHRGAAYSAVSAVAEAGFSARKASTWACASAMTSWKPAAFSSSTIWATIVSGSEPPQEPVSSSLL